MVTDHIAKIQQIQTKNRFGAISETVLFCYAYPREGVLFMFQYFNPNPVGRAVGDCAVRAVSAALGISWEEAYALIAVNGFAMGDMMSSNSVWSSVLRQNGFHRKSIPDSCPDCYTFAEFARDNPKGVFALGTGTHVAVIRDGTLLDAWDSSSEIPQFVWYKP